MRRHKFHFLRWSAFGFLFFGTHAFAENSFSLELYKTLSQKSGDDNFIYSPYSISKAFQLASYGAKGDTLRQINSVFKFQKSAKAVSSLGDDTLAVANRIWIQNGFEVKDAFLNACKTEQGATPGLADFEKDVTGATEEINQWVATQTHDKIQNLIPKNGLDTSTRLVIANAIYFKAKWIVPFKAEMTNLDDFTEASGKKISTIFMHEILQANYSEDKQVQVLRLLYRSANQVQYAMTIVLPKTMSLSGLEKNLTSSQIAVWEKSLAFSRVSVAVPKFTFDSGERLKDPLKKMGLSSPFEPANADFSGIDGKKDLYVSEVFHKAFVKVDEDGTEAAAATAMGMVEGMAMHQSKPIPFSANKPFLFYISEVNSNEVIFMGKVTHPQI